MATESAGAFPVRRVRARAFTVPTDRPEADGTLRWGRTTLVLAELEAGGARGLGYSYAHASAAQLINDTLSPLLDGRDAFEVPAAWQRMAVAVRNLGRPGIASDAIAAVDIALWDLKAKLLGLPLLRLLGAVREVIPAYGSGGFTSYNEPELRAQLGAWAAEGLTRVKMKVGSDPEADPKRVAAARQEIGPDVELFVDANGAYERAQALRLAERFAEQDVRWFEEPVSSDALDDLRLLRAQLPAGMQLAAGEYASRSVDFRRLLEAGAVDVLQADATRCGGVSGFLEAGALAHAWQRPLSAHTAPSLHQHVCCALPAAVHVEYFHDHVRIEQLLFDGAARAEGGLLRPDLSRPGMGLELKADVAERYEV